jgi:hypothetical protein
MERLERRFLNTSLTRRRAPGSRRILPSRHVLKVLGIPCAVHFDLRRRAIDAAQVVGGELHIQPWRPRGDE